MAGRGQGLVPTAESSIPGAARRAAAISEASPLLLLHRIPSTAHTGADQAPEDPVALRPAEEAGQVLVHRRVLQERPTRSPPPRPNPPHPRVRPRHSPTNEKYPVRPPLPKNQDVQQAMAAPDLLREPAK